MSTQHRILVVDDNPTNQRILSIWLNKLGFHVATASNGEEAIGRLAQRDISLILMDCEMPVMDGFEATRRIRQLESGGEQARLPIIAVTAGEQQSSRARCMAAGMDDFLTKPVNFPVLLERIRHFLDHPDTAGNLCVA